MAATTGTAEKHEEAILAALRPHGIEAELRYTTPEDLGEGLAAQAATEQADVVIAAGGDGTIHEVAAGLLGTQSALGIIALLRLCLGSEDAGIAYVDDTEMCAKVTLRLIDDRDLWHELGKQAHIHVKNNYLLPTMVSQYLNALKSALERRAGEV